MTEVRFERLRVHVGGVDVTVATARRGGDLVPILFLHGFGSTKEDYLDIAQLAAFRGRAFVAYDAPGCGETSCDDEAAISIAFLVETARAALRELAVERFYLVGHSMVGLTALLLAHEEPGRVVSFTDIEGNLAPEDCFLSRQVVTHPAEDPDDFLDAFAERTRRSLSPASALYAMHVSHTVRPAAVHGIFESMVELSDHGDLMTKFLSLPCPRMFIYGERNSSLTYLANGIELAAIRTAATGRCTRTPSACGTESATSSAAPSASDPIPASVALSGGAFSARAHAWASECWSVSPSAESSSEGTAGGTSADPPLPPSAPGS